VLLSPTTVAQAVSATYFQYIEAGKKAALTKNYKLWEDMQLNCELYNNLMFHLTHHETGSD
jgi:hypothetical protein